MWWSPRVATERSYVTCHVRWKKDTFKIWPNLHNWLHSALKQEDHCVRSRHMHLISVTILNYQGSTSCCIHQEKAWSLSSGRNDIVAKSTGNALCGKHTIPDLDSWIIILHLIRKHSETQLNAPLLIKDFPTVSRVRQDALWFQRFQHNKQNKQCNFLHKYIFLHKIWVL